MTDQEFLEAAERKVQETNTFVSTLKEKAPYPFITYTLIAINIVIFIIMVTKDAGIMETAPTVAFAWGANFPPETIDNQWWRLISAAFIHYGIIHLLVNMTALYQSGEFVERAYGRVELIVIYMLSAIFGGFGTLLFNTNVVSAGASGAIFGLIGAELTFFLAKRKDIPDDLYGRYFLNLSIFVGYNLFYGLTTKTIDNWAHLGGVLGGMFIVSPFLVRSLFSEINKKMRYAKIIFSIIASIAVIAVLIKPAQVSSQPYINVKNYRKELSKFSKVDSELGSKYQTFYEAANKNPSTTSYLELASFIEQEMIPQLNKGKEDLSTYSTDSDKNVSKIQTETNLYLEIKIKFMSHFMKVVRALSKDENPSPTDEELLGDLAKQLADQDKKLSAIFKEDNK